MSSGKGGRKDTKLGGLTVNQIPQLFWKAEFDRELSELLPGVLPDHARRICSMWLVKTTTGDTWEGVAKELSLPPRQSRGMANKVVSLLNMNGNAELFHSRLCGIADKIANSSGCIDYGALRWTLADFTDIEREEWNGICKVAGIHPGKRGGKSRQAAAWLWSELTSSNHLLSPTYAERDTENDREYYRRFVVGSLPALRRVLIEFGCSLRKL